MSTRDLSKGMVKITILASQVRVGQVHTVSPAFLSSIFDLSIKGSIAFPSRHLTPLSTVNNNAFFDVFETERKTFTSVSNLRLHENISGASVQQAPLLILSLLSHHFRLNSFVST